MAKMQEGFCCTFAYSLDPYASFDEVLLCFPKEVTSVEHNH